MAYLIFLPGGSCGLMKEREMGSPKVLPVMQYGLTEYGQGVQPRSCGNVLLMVRSPYVSVSCD